MAGFLFIARKRRIRERSEELQIAHLATQGKPKAVKDQITQWQKES